MIVTIAVSVKRPSFACQGESLTLPLNERESDDDDDSGSLGVRKILTTSAAHVKQRWHLRSLCTVKKVRIGVDVWVGCFG